MVSIDMARDATHSTCESYHQLDVRELVRRGLLNNSGTITWTRGDHITGTISVQGDGDSITLAYVVDDKEINEQVTIGKTAVHLGGSRSWFLCPKCVRRVAVLYGGKLFRCRHCHDLRYASQREMPRFRAIARIQRARIKLGGSANLSLPRPARPRYMHNRTYENLLREEDAAWRAYTFAASTMS